MQNLKKLWELQQKIYMVYSSLAESTYDEEEKKTYFNLLKLLGFSKSKIMNHMSDSDISKAFVFIQKMREEEEGNLKELDFVDFLYYPANENAHSLCVETLYNELALENATRKKDSTQEEIKTYYTKEYSNRKACYFYDCTYFQNLCALYEEHKNEIYKNDLKYVKMMYGFLVNPYIYASLCEGKELEDVSLDAVDLKPDMNIEINDAILFDLLEDGVNEIEELVSLLQEDSNQEEDESKIEDEQVVPSFLRLDGTLTPMDTDLVDAMEIDPTYPQIYLSLKQYVLPYFLKIKNRQYQKMNTFCALMCFMHIKTYTMMDYDTINRREIIKNLATKNENYEKSEYSYSKGLLETLYEKPKIKEKKKTTLSE